MPIKTTAKHLIQATGWYVRKSAGLPVGVDLFQDLKRFGIQPKCVLDIGAHQGQTALTYASRFLGSCVFAVEPEADNFDQLKRATKGNPDILAVNAAISDSLGTLNLRIHGTNSQGHAITSETDDKTRPVEATTIDEFCSEYRIFPDFIKIDVEGHELRVIAGARNTLPKSPRALLVEATISQTNHRHTQLADLTAALAPYGFSLIALHDQNIWEATGQLEFFNALFVKPPLANP